MKLSQLKQLHDDIRLATYEAGLIQARAYRALKNFMTEELNAANLTLAEWALVGQLYRHKAGLRLSEIAEILSIEPSLATNFVNSLIIKHYVERSNDPKDKRAKIVILSVSGRERVPRIERGLRDQLKAYLIDIPASDLAAYLRTLKKLSDKA